MKVAELYHPDYLALCETWELIEDVCAGSRAVKAKARQYIPQLKKQEKEDYLAYVRRGVFFGATKRTREALTGMLMRRSPKVEPGSIPPAVLADITMSGLSIKALIRRVIENLNSTGRCATVIDWSMSSKRSYVSLYGAREVINWHEERIDDRMELTLLTLRETDDQQRAGTVVRCYKYRQFYREKDSGNVFVKVWTEGTDAAADLIEGTDEPLLKNGKPLRHIPAVIHNAEHFGNAPGAAPLADIAEINIHHLMTSCDLENGRHICGIPTPYATGVDSGTNVLYLGSSQAWTAEKADATFGFMEFTGQGLGALEKSIEEKERQMAVLGARLLMGDKNGVEAAETVRLRSVSETSALTNVSGNSSASLTLMMKWVLWWETPGAGETLSEDSVYILVNDDFIDTPIEAGMLTAVTSSFQLGAMSFDAYFAVLERGEMYPEGWTKEQEIAAIAQAPVKTPPIVDPNEDPDDDAPPEPGKKPATKKPAAKKTAAKKTAKKVAKKVPANA